MRASSPTAPTTSSAQPDPAGELRHRAARGARRGGLRSKAQLESRRDTSRTRSPSGCCRAVARRSLATPRVRGRRRSLDAIRRACRLADVVQQAVKDHAAPGISEAELAGLAAAAMFREAGRRVPGIVTVTTGAEATATGGGVATGACRPARATSSSPTRRRGSTAAGRTPRTRSSSARPTGRHATASTRSAARCTTGSRSAARASSRRTSTGRCATMLAEHGPTYAPPHRAPHRRRLVGGAADHAVLRGAHRGRHGAGARACDLPARSGAVSGSSTRSSSVATRQRDPDAVRAHAVKDRDGRDDPGQRSLHAPGGQLAGRARRRQRRAREADDRRRARRLGRSVLRRRHGVRRRCASCDGAVRRRPRSLEPRGDAPRRVHARPLAVPRRHRQLRVGRDRHGALGHLRTRMRPAALAAARWAAGAGADLLLLPRARHAESLADAGRRRPRTRLRGLLPQGRARRRRGSRAWSPPCARRSGRGRGCGSMRTAAGRYRRLCACCARWRSYEIDFVEQPVRDHPVGHLAELRSRTDDHRLRERRTLVARPTPTRAIRARQADVFCFSPYWVGSVARFHRLAWVAEYEGLQVCKHTHGELGLAAAAAHHVVLDPPERRGGPPADRVHAGARHPHRAAPDRERAALGHDRRAGARRRGRRGCGRGGCGAVSNRGPVPSVARDQLAKEER